MCHDGVHHVRPARPRVQSRGSLVLQAVGRRPAVRLPVGPGGLSPCCGAASWWPWLTLAPAMRQLASPLSKTKKNQLPKFKNRDFYIKIWIFDKFFTATCLCGVFVGRYHLQYMPPPTPRALFPVPKEAWCLFISRLPGAAARSWMKASSPETAWELQGSTPASTHT